jgi:tRNA uridine 5-carboxymethylaminomethyl modification enzyme
LTRLETRIARVEALWAGLARIKRGGATAQEWLARPGTLLSDWMAEYGWLSEYTKEERERVQVRARYGGYLARERRRIERARGLERVGIPDGLDYSGLQGISTEGREKLARIQPSTVGQAARISGVSPSDVGVLLVELRRRAG